MARIITAKEKALGEEDQMTRVRKILLEEDKGVVNVARLLNRLNEVIQYKGEM